MGKTKLAPNKASASKIKIICLKVSILFFPKLCDHLNANDICKNKPILPRKSVTH